MDIENFEKFLEKLSDEIERILDRKFKAEMGFALVIFPLEVEGFGSCITNVDNESIIKVFKTFLDKYENNSKPEVTLH